MDAGVAREAQIFVACLPFSGLIYAEATWTQRVEDWLSSHVRAFTAIGGVAAALVPDNLKSGVTRANFFDPVLNASYYELARHYGTASCRPGPASRGTSRRWRMRCCRSNAGSWRRCATAPSSGWTS